MSEAGVTTDEILAERDYQDSFWGGPEDSGPGAGARCRRRSSEALVRPQEWGSQ